MEIRDYMDELDFDDEEFGAVEERIDIINRLSLKYGSTTEEIIAYGEAKRVELEKLMDGENYLESLRSKKEKQVKYNQKSYTDNIFCNSLICCVHINPICILPNI